MSGKKTLSRRAFMKQAAGTVVVGGSGLGLLGLARSCWVPAGPRTDAFLPLQQVTGYPSVILRPPGAVKEKELVARCIKCMKCSQACPRMAIQFLDSSWGRSYGTPVVIPGVRSCNLCRSPLKKAWGRKECIAVCPTGALQPVEDYDIEMGTAEIDKKICRMYLDDPKEHPEDELEGRKHCNICHKVCPVGITVETEITGIRRKFLASDPFVSDETKRTGLEDRPQRAIKRDRRDRPSVDEDVCIGCGQCEADCPQEDKAIRIKTDRKILV